MSVARASVVVPVRNEADHIGRVLRSYLDACRQLPCEIELLPVINGERAREGERGGSSLEICRALAEHDPAVRTLCLDEAGWGRAVRYGLEQASGDLLCFTNGARTTAADLVHVLEYAIAHPACAVKATRPGHGSWTRRAGSRVYNLECRLLFQLPWRDINGTPKVFPRRFARLLQLRETGDLIDLEFCVCCQRLGYALVDVPVASSVRHSGRSTTGWRSAVGLCAGALRRRAEWAEWRAS